MNKILDGYWTLRIHKRKGLAVLFLFIMLGLLLLSFKYQIADSLARWLDVRDNPVPCDVICVMGGRAERRLPHAIELLRKGFGGKLIISTGRQDRWISGAFEKYGVKNYDETVIDAILKKESIEPSVCAILTDSLSTLDDARKFREYYEKNRFESALIVTDPVHSRRSMLCIKCCFDGTGVRYYACPIESTGFAEKFADRDDYVNYVIEELLRLFFYTFGIKSKH